MGRPSKQILDFMEKYRIDSDEIWEVYGTSWVVKHKALERVAIEVGIKWETPQFVQADAQNKIAVICVFGSLGEHREWSVGEASPANNKNGYPYAMAEKRAKDRVILKLLSGHGMLYSEAEADEFTPTSNSDGSVKRTTLAKKDAKGIYAKLQDEMQKAPSRELLREWGADNSDRISTLPEDWQDTLRLQFEELMADLRQRESI